MKEYFLSDGFYLELDLDFPYEAMLEEAKRLKEFYVPHRDNESIGWKSLTIHGHGETKTGTWQTYGYKNSVEASKDLHWTSVADECPITYKYLTEQFPSNRLGRVRFMLLEAGGHIGMHTDAENGTRVIENINLALNNPKDCVWKWQDFDEHLEMIEGHAYAMNLSYHHTVVNPSNEDRYHMIVTRHDATSEWKQLMDSASYRQNIKGKYVTFNELP